MGALDRESLRVGWAESFRVALPTAVTLSLNRSSTRSSSGTRAKAVLSWNGVSAATAGLKIPVQVVGIEDGTVGVRFHHFPREPAVHRGLAPQWPHSHSARRSVPARPCSATIVAWAEKNEATAEDEEIGLDDDDLEGDDLEEQRPDPAWPSNITIPSEEELEGLQEALDEIGSED